MFAPLAPIRRFVADTRGAVTVDYVVITAAAVGLGFAVNEVLFGGMGVLAGNVNDELGGKPGYSGPGLVYSDGFDNGAVGWVGADAKKMFGVGTVLGPIAGGTGAQTVTKVFDVAADATEATISFDLLSLDSLDNESGYVYIGDQVVGYVTSEHGKSTFTAVEQNGITIVGNVIEQDIELGGMMIEQSWSRDSRTSIQITVTNPGESIKFGFGSDANQGISDESFAIDNFTMLGLADPA
ncbi:hypothetical protein ACK8OR_00025 [Jannaschia sp. KMU-145]|uniref:hypothetical protein n=1 Tax=Jannaschia halovivens TaxID=3388667 RepID=UPI00396B1F84